MKKFGMLMVMVSLLGYTVGCGGTAEDTTAPAEPAPTAEEGAAEADAGAADDMATEETAE